MQGVACPSSVEIRSRPNLLREQEPMRGGARAGRAGKKEVADGAEEEQVVNEAEEEAARVGQSRSCAGRGGEGTHGPDPSDERENPQKLESRGFLLSPMKEDLRGI